LPTCAIWTAGRVADLRHKERWQRQESCDVDGATWAKEAIESRVDTLKQAFGGQNAVDGSHDQVVHHTHPWSSTSRAELFQPPVAAQPVGVVAGGDEQRRGAVGANPAAVQQLWGVGVDDRGDLPVQVPG
jgi:hypothetical protein